MTPRRRGFTLLELLLAMSIAAMLMLTLYACMNVAIRAKRTAAAAVDPARSASIAAELVTQDLQGVLPPTGIMRGPFTGTRLPAAGGNADSLEFYCVGRDQGEVETPMSDGIRKVNLVLRTDVTPPVLMRRVTRNLLSPTTPVPEEEVLCRNVRSFTVQYYDGFNWLGSWDSTTVGDVLPIAVSIRLEMEDPTATVPGGAKPLVISRIIPLAAAKPLDEPIIGGAQ